jgi:alkanesulfonate monooxygenase SsuD/methylene tetrahydromethanopterin reductase-like flavin-dependent oxidoreductase (luciferase family)
MSGAPESFELGVTLPQFTDDPSRLLDAARRAETLGFDSIWLFDHLWPLSGGKERPILECWTTLAYLAAATDRITLGTLVTRSSLRHPAVLAKMAATVSSIAPGRLIVGVGSGDDLSRKENEAYGIDYFAGADRVDQLEETVMAVTLSLSGESVTCDGDFTSLEDLTTSPRAQQRPRVWVAGRSGDATSLAGRLADGWNGWAGTPEDFGVDAAEVIEAAKGRPVELTWAGLVSLKRDSSSSPVTPEHDRGVISGSAETIAGTLSGYLAAGARHLVVTPTGAWNAADLEYLAGEIRPLIAH